jgi:hypothetical protein
MRTSVYIDGFNFYYLALRNTPYKWLDYLALCKSLLGAHHQILNVKYFTAQVSGRSDPAAADQAADLPTSVDAPRAELRGNLWSLRDTCGPREIGKSDANRQYGSGVENRRERVGR